MNSLQEFYDFFNGISQDKWTTGSLSKGDTHCAIGFLKDAEKEEPSYHSQDAETLAKLLAQSRAIPIEWGNSTALIWHVNDG